VAPDPILRDIPEEIESRQLNIRPPRPGDGEMVFEAMRESLVDLRRFPASLPWALPEPSLAASEKFCREGYANFLARRDLPLLLFLKESGGMVGASGLHRIDWRVPGWARAALRRSSTKRMNPRAGCADASACCWKARCGTSASIPTVRCATPGSTLSRDR
jgi:hypothetical protein